MSIIKIEYDKIDDNTAEALIRICPFNAIVVDKGRLVINEACRLCKICVKKFPDIVKIQKEEIKHIDKNLWKGIAVYVELTPQGIHPVSFELIGEALKLEKCINQPVYALILGNKLDNSIEELKYYGLTSIYAYDNARHLQILCKPLKYGKIKNIFWRFFQCKEKRHLKKSGKGNY